MLAAADLFAFSKKADAPDTGKPNDGIAQPAEQSRIAFKEPRHKIKLEKSPKPPIESTQDH